MKLSRIEFNISVYMLISGLLFVVYPAALQLPVYSDWSRLAPEAWGLILIGISGLHFGALYLNGRDRMYSLPIRSLACFLHLLICLTFAGLFFAAKAYWGCVLFVWLVPSLLAPIMQSVLTDWMRVIRGKQARYGH